MLYSQLQVALLFTYAMHLSLHQAVNHSNTTTACQYSSITNMHITHWSITQRGNPPRYRMWCSTSETASAVLQSTGQQHE